MASRLSQHRFDTVEHAVESLARWKRCSVVVEDSRFRLVAYSSHPDATAADLTRLRTVLEKRAPKDVVSAMRRRGVLRQLRSATEAVRTPPLPEVGLGERVVVSLQEGGTSFGYLWVEDRDNRLAAADLQEITAFAVESVLPLVIELHRRDRARYDDPSNLLSELLRGDALDEKAESRIRSEFFPGPNAAFYLAAAWGKSLPVDVVKRLELSAGSGSHVDFGHISTRLDGTVYILLSPLTSDRSDAAPGGDRARPIDPLDRFLDGVRAMLVAQSGNVGLGVSEPFLQMGDIPWAASFALRAAVISARFFGGRRVVAADEYPHFVASLSHHAEATATFPDRPSSVAPWLRRISEYDGKHGTSLALTLERYLDHGGRVGDAASALHVHPNTLLYRLKRVEELAKIDLRNGVERTLVHVELKMWTALEESKRFRA